MAEEAQALGLALGLGPESSPGTTTVEVTRAGASRSRQRRTSPRVERARRQTMSALFAELGALLPDGLPHRACRADVLDGAIAYVRALEDAAAELEAHRAMSAGRGRAGGAGAEVVASGETSCFAVRLRAARPGALTRVLGVFQRHCVPVLAATVARDGGEAAVTVTTAVVAPAVAGKIEADIISSA